MWCVPELNKEYIERMEDVLKIYEKPLDFLEPVVCLDEKPLQLLKNVNSTSRMVAVGNPRKKDYEYQRKGTASVFCAIEPMKGRHFVHVAKHRRASDFADFLRVIERSYPHATKIHLVMDNLNTHSMKSLTKTLGPKRGSKLWNRFKVHFTPKHASWLNQAETQISMFSRECLGKDRIATLATVRKRANAWMEKANRAKRRIDWRFTRAKARKKFKYEYPHNHRG